METIKVPLQSGAIAWLSVANCDGYCTYGRDDLKCDDLDYVIKFLSIKEAQNWYEKLNASNATKVAHIQAVMLQDQGNSNYEIPFLAGHGLEWLEIVNEAHVIPALINLGAKRIPFKMHKHFAEQMPLKITT